MPIRLKSAAKHIYNGVTIFPGQEFEVTNEQDADDLIALHFATRVKPQRQPSRRTYKRRDMSADSES
jgi:hypothetical protein